MMPSWYKPPRYRAVTGLELVAAIARLHGYTAAQLIGPSRVASVCLARRRAMQACRDRGMSQSSIGRLFNRDHSTVAHGLRRLAA